MRTLLMHDITPDDAAAAVLEAAGHTLVRCAEPGSEGFPCAGIDGSCPLDGSVDVAVVVHDRPSTDLAVGEIGVVCALRDGVPLVVAGNGTHSPVQPLGAELAVSVEDLPEACRRAVAAAAERASRYASACAGADATVERTGHSVSVTLAAGSTNQHMVRAHHAANRLFPAARTINVSVRSR